MGDSLLVNRYEDPSSSACEVGKNGLAADHGDVDERTGISGSSAASTDSSSA